MSATVRLRSAAIFTLCLPATGPTAAVTLLDRAGSMATRAGEIVGATPGCGVPEARLLAAHTKAVELIKLSGEPADSIRRARSIYDSFSARATAATRSEPDLGPTTMPRTAAST